MEVAANIKQSTAALAAAAAASSGAMAADMPKVPPSPVPVSTWQGFYLGGSVGASWLRSVQDDPAAVGSVTSVGLFPANSTTGGSISTANGVGWLGGLNLGYNLQSGNFVYGVEGDFSWVGSTSASSSGSFTNGAGYPSTYLGFRTHNGTTVRSSSVDALATFRARFGIDFAGTLPYFTAGVAWGRFSNLFSISGAGYNGTKNTGTVTQTSWVPGIALGGGVEHKLSQSWTLRGEIMWVGFADRQIANPLFSTTYGSLTSTGGPVKFSNSLTVGKIGLNYRF
jgi:outer membrane immunogenic protein